MIRELGEEIEEAKQQQRDAADQWPKPGKIRQK